jgi:hypothetical protein
MDDFTSAINADGGRWAEAEILGNHALVKVQASPATLATIGAAPGFTTIPGHVQLTDTLADLTAGQRTGIVNKLQALGYSLTEIRTVMPAGGWGSVTLGQVLKFAATRRLKPRYDSGTDSIIFDGPVQPVRPVDSLDQEVK